ncbi:MAG: AI-2E family transporter [Opitutales bacterium]|nr:AI-2E family transporter [Opitutales bacterium]
MSPLQRKIVGAALVCFSALVIAGVLFGVFLLLRAFVTTFSMVLWPLAVAGVLALLLRPVVHLAERGLRLSRIGGILLLYGCVLLVCALAITLFVPVLLEQSVQFARNLPTLLESIRAGLTERFPQVKEFLLAHLGDEKLDRYQASLLENLEGWAQEAVPAAGRIGNWLMGIFSWAAAVAIIPVYLFFFLLSDRDLTDDLDEQLSFIQGDVRSDILFLVREFAQSMVAFFRGQIVIGLIMGVLMAIGFTVFGINFGIVLGILIGVLNIVPYLGTILGLATVLPIAYFQPDGGMATMGFALGVFTVVQLFESYFLTPRIMGQSTGLHPLVIIIAIFFWGTALGGILGMILAIPLTAFFVVFWRLMRKKYLRRLMESS